MKDVFYQNLNDGSVEVALTEAGYNPKVESNWTTKKAFLVYDNIGTVKTEYNCQQPSFRAGFNKRHNHDQIDILFNGLTEAFSESEDVEVVRTPCGIKNDIPGSCVDVFGLSTPEEFVEFCDIIKSIVTESSSIGARSRQATATGVSFEGSNFSNAHERATTIGNRFMKMVCKASGMSDNYDSEWGVEDGGRIDAVEIDEETGKIVSIYECQSGIQNGDYLDDTHLNKALLRYPADPAIAPTLKKIVILAGGYTKAHLETIKGQAENLWSRNIEVVLLRTTRTDDKIGVEVVELF
jgi:hypothetical protein